jgi:integrase
MRSNKFGVRHLSGYNQNGRYTYFWIAPIALQRARVFRSVTLGTDFQLAKAKAAELNRRLDEYRIRVHGLKPKLETIKPMSVGYLFRLFEASPKFARYSERSRQDYPYIYRRLETRQLANRGMFGDVKIRNVTRQMAYAIYEGCIANHGFESAKKMMTACQAAFKYATFRLPNISGNPFSRLGKISTPPRRQRWTEDQLDAFIGMAEKMGYPGIGRCALLCVELMQRPGDMLSLTWGAYDETRGAWFVRQTKKGVEILVPPTKRLHAALNIARQSAQARARGSDISNHFVCPTRTGKRWHRRDFTKTARTIARAAGIPDELQIRDLRRTAATEGASAGATPAELMAVGGWQNVASIRPYLVQTSEQAAAFQAKRDAYRNRQPRAARSH